MRETEFYQYCILASLRAGNNWVQAKDNAIQVLNDYRRQFDICVREKEENPMLYSVIHTELT